MKTFLSRNREAAAQAVDVEPAVHIDDRRAGTALQRRMADVAQRKAEDPMQGAGLEEEPMQGAGLEEEPMQGAGMEEEPMQGAGLEEEPVQGAGLEEEPMQGAGLEEEPMQGAGLEEEPMQGAGLEEEPMQGAGLEEEPMQAAGLEEEPMQGAGLEDEPAQAAGLGTEAPLRRAAESSGASTGLPPALKTGVENLSGFSMSDVKVHYNSAQPKQLRAHAYAQGTDIHIGPGQEKHLPHEAWHVVQQKQGRVQATRQMKGGGMPVNDNPGLEHEADVMGAKAVQMIEGLAARQFKSEALNGVVQMDRWERGRLITDAEDNYRAMYDRFIRTWGFAERAKDGRYTDATDNKKKLPGGAWQNLFDQLDVLITQACAGGMMLTQNFDRFGTGTPVALMFAQVEAAGTGGTGGILPAGILEPGNIPMVDHPDEVAVTNFIGRAQLAYNNWTPNPTLGTRGPVDPGPRLNATRIGILSHRTLPPGWTFHISISGAWALHHAGPGNAPTFIFHT